MSNHMMIENGDSYPQEPLILLGFLNVGRCGPCCEERGARNGLVGTIVNGSTRPEAGCQFDAIPMATREYRPDLANWVDIE